ncbi:unnamed protein product [Protopolystoma xenopodis]|uniref:Uncharacterized protein n=1 Tax=Protopolystoma xenopodis TaxID=117903 RepID=A0A3S5BJY7_9PLAT|nr:unnamed protein product [Protopolystoma xenopodis]
MGQMEIQQVSIVAQRTVDWKEFVQRSHPNSMEDYGGVKTVGLRDEVSVETRGSSELEDGEPRTCSHNAPVFTSRLRTVEEAGKEQEDGIGPSLRRTSQVAEPLTLSWLRLPLRLQTRSLTVRLERPSYSNYVRGR